MIKRKLLKSVLAVSLSLAMMITASVSAFAVGGQDVTVIRGDGDGNYDAGDTVSVSADVAPEGMQFKTWKGNVDFADPTNPNTSFTMTDEEVYAYAFYEFVNVVNGAEVAVENVMAEPGETVEVDIMVDNSPGLTSMKLYMDYDQSVLTLVSTEFNSEFGSLTSSMVGVDGSHILNWVDGENSWGGDFLFATLTFKVSDTATKGEYPISLNYDAEDLFNLCEMNMPLAVVDGVFEVVVPSIGDIDGDGVIDNRDVIALFNYISDDSTFVIIENSDVNGDGVINNQDVMALMNVVSTT